MHPHAPWTHFNLHFIVTLATTNSHYYRAYSASTPVDRLSGCSRVYWPICRRIYDLLSILPLLHFSQVNLHVLQVYLSSWLAASLVSPNRYVNTLCRAYRRCPCLVMDTKSAKIPIRGGGKYNCHHHLHIHRVLLDDQMQHQTLLWRIKFRSLLFGNYRLLGLPRQRKRLPIFVHHV